MSAYSPHAAFAAPAHARNSLVLLVIGFGLVEVFYRLGYDAIDQLLLRFKPEWHSAFYLGATPFSLFAQLVSFLVLAGAVLLVVRVLHKRGLLSLIGDLRLAWPQFLTCFVFLIVLLALLECIPPWWSFDALARMRSFGTWALLMPLALFAIFIQIAAEELLYRGYVQQQIAARFAHPAIWLIVPNLAFAAAHWDTSGGFEASVQYVVWAFFFGLVASDLTARSGTLGPALALHLANNTFAFVLYGELGGPSSGFALFLFPEGSMGATFSDPDNSPLISWQLIVELVMLLLMWLAARMALKR